MWRGIATQVRAHRTHGTQKIRRLLQDATPTDQTQGPFLLMLPPRYRPAPSTITLRTTWSSWQNTLGAASPAHGSNLAPLRRKGPTCPGMLSPTQWLSYWTLTGLCSFQSPLSTSLPNPTLIHQKRVPSPNSGGDVGTYSSKNGKPRPQSERDIRTPRLSGLIPLWALTRSTHEGSTR